MKKLLLSFAVLLVLSACSTDTLNNHSDPTKAESKEHTTYETIELADIPNFVEEGFIIADVREVDEFESGHIPGAINAPLSAIQNGDFSALDPKEKYVIICRSGNRSVTASDLLSNEGFEIVNVREGMSSWTGKIE